MAATDSEKRELITKADSDLQFVLGEAGLSLDAQFRVVQRHTTLRRFQARTPGPRLAQQVRRISDWMMEVQRVGSRLPALWRPGNSPAM